MREWQVSDKRRRVIEEDDKGEDSTAMRPKRQMSGHTLGIRVEVLSMRGARRDSRIGQSGRIVRLYDTMEHRVECIMR